MQVVCESRPAAALSRFTESVTPATASSSAVARRPHAQALGLVESLRVQIAIYRPQKCFTPTWPAIPDIWLGIRTVPVLSVAKESRGASQIAHWPRSARTQAGRCGLTDRRSSVKKLLSFCPFVDVSVSSRRNHRAWDACRVCAVRPTIEVGRCQSSFAYCEAEFDLGKGKNRSEATYPHWKDENNNRHWQTNPNSHVYESESQSEVDVRCTWPAMYA